MHVTYLKDPTPDAAVDPPHVSRHDIWDVIGTSMPPLDLGIEWLLDHVEAKNGPAR